MFMRSSESSIPEIDLRQVRDALILRWWIIPLAMLISVGFLFANESDLQTSPAHVLISRLYEARDESAAMTVAGIDPASIVPYPSFDNQLVALQSPETRKQIADSINAETPVSVTRSDQTFSLIDSIAGEGKKRFTFLSVGTPSYTFLCTASTAKDCNTAIDAYVVKISQLRAQSIQLGFERAEIIMDALISKAQNENPSLVMQRQALAVGKSLVTGEMTLISAGLEDVGPTVRKVKASTYGFGLGVGALLGLLVVLQLSVTDKKIRTRRKLVALVGEEHNLGTLRLDQQDPSSQHVAAGLVHQLKLHGVTNARLLSIDGENTDLAATALTQALHGQLFTVTPMRDVDHLTTMELVPPPHSVVVLMADSLTSRADHLERVWAISEHAGNTIIGVILVQH
jgi:hypothetical protein